MQIGCTTMDVMMIHDFS